MSLPLQAIDRLFTRLAATYGAEWERSLGSAPLADVQTAWARELSGFSSRLADIAWALEHLPERCPNVIAFRNLCRQAPRAPEPPLPAPQADPQRVAAELAKLGQARQAHQAEGAADPRAWARAIVARAEQGERISRTVTRFAREALRLPVAAQ